MHIFMGMYLSFMVDFCTRLGKSILRTQFFIGM